MHKHVGQRTACTITACSTAPGRPPPSLGREQPHSARSEAAGIVVALGEAVVRVGLADRVYISGTAEASDGTYAQYVLCGELQASRPPPSCRTARLCWLSMSP